MAAIFGGKRRGPSFRDEDGGTNDIVHDHYSIEVKLLGRPGFQDLLNACRQAEAAAGAGQEPLAVVKKKHAPDDDALVVMRLETFREWRL